MGRCPPPPPHPFANDCQTPPTLLPSTPHCPPTALQPPSRPPQPPSSRQYPLLQPLSKPALQRPRLSSARRHEVYPQGHDLPPLLPPTKSRPPTKKPLWVGGWLRGHPFPPQTHRQCRTLPPARLRGHPPPLCDIPSGCCSFTGPWTVTPSSLRMLRRVAAFCRPLRPVLLLVPFPRSRSPVVGVPCTRQRRPVVGVLRMCWLLPESFDCFCCPHAPLSTGRP